MLLSMYDACYVGYGWLQSLRQSFIYFRLVEPAGEEIKNLCDIININGDKMKLLLFVINLLKAFADDNTKSVVE